MQGGIYLGTNENESKYYHISTDTHTVIVGATRSGKSRRIGLPSIALMSSFDENLVITDPKGELFLYTGDFLEKQGYEVIALDFIEFAKSNRYNFLKPIIDAVNDNDIPLAVNRTRDIVSMLMSSSAKGRVSEPIWENGERAVLTCGILAVVYENKASPKYQNLTNVYHFLGTMCKDDRGKIPLVDYLEGLDIRHPARASIAISDVAPGKTRASFYASALSRLELFTDINMYNMSSETDYDIYDYDKKRAIFLIFPDYKTTYHRICALFIYQHYQLLAEHSSKNGNRLNRRTHFLLDEIGNFPEIPKLDTIITVSGGRGILLHLMLQDFNQLDQTYGDKVGKIIRSNCETWIYLRTDNIDTLKELSEKLGKYTIKSNNISYSTHSSNVSSSSNFAGRSLLEPNEVSKIASPYILVTSRNDPAIMYAPDLSQLAFNKIFGLGDERFNQQLQIERNNARKTRETRQIDFWNVTKTKDIPTVLDLI